MEHSGEYLHSDAHWGQVQESCMFRRSAAVCQDEARLNGSFFDLTLSSLSEAAKPVGFDPEMAFCLSCTNPDYGQACAMIRGASSVLVAMTIRYDVCGLI